MASLKRAGSHCQNEQPERTFHAYGDGHRHAELFTSVTRGNRGCDLGHFPRMKPTVLILITTIFKDADTEQ